MLPRVVRKTGRSATGSTLHRRLLVGCCCLPLSGCTAVLELAGETVEFAVETTAEAVETVGELTLMAVGVASSAGKSALNSPYETKDDELDGYYR